MSDKVAAEAEPKKGDLRKWLSEVKLAEREHEPYFKRADRVVKRYRDEDRKERNSDVDLPARYNILWSNTETTAPALFNKTPNVQVDRRFKDADPIGRVASQIWERSTQFSIDNYDFGGVMRATIKDYQLAGRGTAWVRYEPSVNDQGISYQEVLCDHVHYKDFLHAPAKQWQSVRWVARKIYLNRKQLKDRFGNSIGSKIGLDYSPTDKDEGEGRKTSDQAEFKQARIYEIWDSNTMNVYWVSKAYPDGIIDVLSDPLGLHDFYPTPKPLFGVTTTETLIPIPEYCLYQDQARELDQLTMKIALLEDALRMVGFYDAAYMKEMGSLYANPRANEMIPIANWQKLQSAGGIKGIAEWMPIQEIIEALTALYASREQVKKDLYEITGIADIIRGSSSPTETATAQQIKGQFATMRISERQRDVERYARDLIALQGEIIAEHFEPEIIAAMSGYDVSQHDVQQTFMQAVELLKSDPMRSFRISIETDSMVAIDEALDKQRTSEFMSAFGGLLESSIKTMQVAPVLAPMLGEVMMFTVRRFNAGRSVESAIEQGMQGLVQMAQQALQQPQKPDPEMLKVQGQMQLEQTKSQNDFVLKQQELKQKAELAQTEMAGRMQLEQEKTVQQMALQKHKVEGELALAAEKARIEVEIKHKELDQKDSAEHKKMLLGAKLPNMHVLSDGTLTTHPIIVKQGSFDFDPVTGKRVFTVIERPVSGDGEDLGPSSMHSGVVDNDPVTGQRRATIVETPIQAEQPGTTV